MAEDLAQALGNQETAVLEFKREVSDLQTLRKVVCALANDLTAAGSGDLLIGVDKHGQPYPTVTDDATLLHYLSVCNDGDLLPRPSMTVTAGQYAGNPVVRVHVQAADLPPVRTRGIAWVRPGPQTRAASANDERVLIERRSVANLPFDARGLAGTTIDALDLELLRSTFITAAVDPDVLSENDRPVEQQLASLGLIDRQGRVTPTGIALGAYDPTAWLPGQYVQFVRYAGSDAGADILDEEEVRDNLITAVRTLNSLIQANLVQHPESSGSLIERQISAYPIAALREVLMNAIMHRSLEGTHAPVRLQWFDDRVEVSNPGGPFGVVTSRNYATTNDYRNPVLATAMKTLGLVNRFGRGIARTTRLMQSNGNPPPEFIIDESSWTVTLRGVQ